MIVVGAPIDGMFLNCGWETGELKATRGSGWALIDEHRAAAVAH